MLDRVNVPAGYEDLAVQLATLRPEGMNYEGIAECLKRPDLTRAWTEHALSTQEPIRNTPAYIRAGVRSGKLPVTDAEKEAVRQARKQRRSAAVDYGWDDPALKDWTYLDLFRPNNPGPRGNRHYGWDDLDDESHTHPTGGDHVH